MGGGRGERGVSLRAAKVAMGKQPLAVAPSQVHRANVRPWACLYWTAQTGPRTHRG